MSCGSGGGGRWGDVATYRAFMYYSEEMDQVCRLGLLVVRGLVVGLCGPLNPRAGSAQARIITSTLTRS